MGPCFICCRVHCDVLPAAFYPSILTSSFPLSPIFLSGFAVAWMNPSAPWLVTTAFLTLIMSKSSILADSILYSLFCGDQRSLLFTPSVAHERFWPHFICSLRRRLVRRWLKKQFPGFVLEWSADSLVSDWVEASLCAFVCVRMCGSLAVALAFV